MGLPLIPQKKVKKWDSRTFYFRLLTVFRNSFFVNNRDSKNFYVFAALQNIDSVCLDDCVLVLEKLWLGLL